MKSAVTALVGNPPAVEPLEVAPLLTGSNHTKRNGSEQPVQANDDHIQYGKDAPANLVVELPRCEVETEPHCQNGEPQRRVVVVNICNTAHGHERKVVQDPADDGVDSGVVDLVDFGLLEVVVATLPADDVVEDNKTEYSKTGCAAPVDEWVTKKEVLYDCKRN